MSKATIIRKKALDLVKDQDWPGAIKEYKRLVELDQSNPNVHNELADIYLKTSQKTEAYDAFVRAVDEYTRVGLHNNAVAVCKKVLRVLPGRVDVLTKLGYIRARQGLGKEAESYYLQFLDKTGAGGLEAAAFSKIADGIIAEMKDSATVLHRLSQALVSYRLNDEAGNVLIMLFQLQQKAGDSAGAEASRAVIERLGFTAKLEIAISASARPGEGGGKDGPIITESNIWTRTHSEGERIEVETTPRYNPGGNGSAPAEPAAPAAPAGPSERDLYLLRLARGSADARPKAAAAQPEATASPAPETVATTTPALELPAAAPEVAVPSSATAVATATPPQAEAPAPTAAATPRSAPTAAGNPMNISALIDDDGAESESDFRSHYDLGMAYLEMDLLSEAIREYQIAARSPQYLIKCLEMIGLCFVKQNQPQLAIRQLTKGLGLIGNDSEESLGIKYNLGLAYEMTGDLANARTYFEDVYVVDVTFRDVADKISRLADS